MPKDPSQGSRSPKASPKASRHVSGPSIAAGPSSERGRGSSSKPPASSSIAATSYAVIPSYGPEFFEYRRRLFLANEPLPVPPPGPVPATYRVPLPLPEPLPEPPSAPSSSSSVGRLEVLLAEEGAEETLEAWKAGLAGVHQRLEAGKRLTRGLRLGLVVKVLKAGWIRDGTWPMDPETKRAAKPPDDPFLDSTGLPYTFVECTAPLDSVPAAVTGGNDAGSDDLNGQMQEETGICYHEKDIRVDTGG